MADQSPNTPPDTSVSTRYFKTDRHGLSVVLSQDTEDRTTVEVDEVRFTPVRFKDKRHGDFFSVGFLATDDDYVQQVLDEDPSVEEIKKSEYDKAVKSSDED